MKERKILIPGIYAILIILLAWTDALFFNGNKSASKVIEEITHIMFVCLPLIYIKDPTHRYFIKLLITYVLLRWALFDPFFNLFSGLEVEYIGTTDIWNKALNTMNINLFGWWVLRIFPLLITFILWRYQKN